MRFFLLLWCLAGLALSGARRPDVAHKHLTDAAIEQTLSQARFSLIYFYSDTCQYCHHFNPTFDYVSVVHNGQPAAAGAADARPPLQVLKANGNSESRLVRLFRVSSFPTLKLLNFDTMEIIDYPHADRDLSSVLAFLESIVPDAVPNFDNFRSSVVDVGASSLDETLAVPGTLVAVVTPYVREWANHNYPSHFFQQLAAGSEFPAVRFALADPFAATGNFVSGLRISNFPSLVYVGDHGRFKTLRTHSQNHLINDKLSETDIRTFLADLSSDTGDDYTGSWYAGVDHLRRQLDASKDYDGFRHVQRKGFNFNGFKPHGEASQQSVDDEYAELIASLEL